MSPSLLNNSNIGDIRMRDDFLNQSTKHLPTTWEDQLIQATKVCEAWKSEADESNRKVNTNTNDSLILCNLEKKTSSVLHSHELFKEIT